MEIIMEELTARQALELCQELWEWVYANPKKDKEDWPRWEELGYMLASCPLCEYARQKEGRRCCLVYWRKKPGLRNHCTQEGSPYLRWVYAPTLRSKRYWAGRIVKLCKEALEKYPEEAVDEKKEHTARS